MDNRTQDNKHSYAKRRRITETSDTRCHLEAMPILPRLKHRTKRKQMPEMSCIAASFTSAKRQEALEEEKRKMHKDEDVKAEGPA